MARRTRGRGLVFLSLVVAAVLIGSGAGALLGTCGPFADTPPDGFCSFIVEIFYLGITTGTTPGTYDPAAVVNRTQMAAFLSRTVDAVLKRESRRAALGRLWTPRTAAAAANFMTTTPSPSPLLIQADGADIWVQMPARISRFRASDGKWVSDYIGGEEHSGLLVAGEWIFTTAKQIGTSVIHFYRINTQTGNLAFFPIPSKANSITFDGTRIFMASYTGSLSVVTVGLPFTVWPLATVTTGFVQPWGTLFDGSNVWVTDASAGKLFKLNDAGGILQTVTVGPGPEFPAFDGANIWVPNSGTNSVSVVRASSGAVLATLTGNGIATPVAAAFDGERILLTNDFADSVSLFKAADLSPLGSISSGGFPYGACSDGINFWVTLNTAQKILRF
jgi:hypothetical protein